MKKIMLFAFIPAVTFGALAQTTADKKYEPNQMQALRLQVKQKDAQIAQIQYQQAQTNFTKALNDLTAEGETIRKENAWPAELRFNPESLQFTMPPPAPKTEKK